MKASEALRRMLDERGVEYDVRDGRGIKNTYWDDAEGRRWGYASDEDGAIEDRQLFLVRGRMDVTPEQAIEFTLGRGTCRVVKETETIRSMLRGEVEVTDEKCSECGGYMEVGAGVLRNYCPNCGRKVVK